MRFFINIRAENHSRITTWCSVSTPFKGVPTLLESRKLEKASCTYQLWECGKISRTGSSSWTFRSDRFSQVIFLAQLSSQKLHASHSRHQGSPASLFLSADSTSLHSNVDSFCNKTTSHTFWISTSLPNEKKHLTKQNESSIGSPCGKQSLVTTAVKRQRFHSWRCLHVVGRIDRNLKPLLIVQSLEFMEE